MTKVLLEITVSLDGNVAGPDASSEEPMGRGGEQLHDLRCSRADPRPRSSSSSRICSATSVP